MNTTPSTRSARLLTWSELDRAAGEVLLIINSPEDGHAEVALVLEALSRIAGDQLLVIASPAWREFVSARGVAPERVLLTETSSGVVEINHFLETSDMLNWVRHRPIRVILGSAPHNQYNLEVKDIFEQRVLLLLRDGDFLAHSLPGPYLYLFDAPSLVARFGRSRKVLGYLDKRDALLGELEALWAAEGRPAVSDSQDFSPVIDAVARHLGHEIVNYDEQRPLPVCGESGSPGDAAVAAYVDHLLGVLLERDRLFAASQAALAEEVQRPLSQHVWLRLRQTLGLDD